LHCARNMQWIVLLVPIATPRVVKASRDPSIVALQKCSVAAPCSECVHYTVPARLRVQIQFQSASHGPSTIQSGRKSATRADSRSGPRRHSGVQLRLCTAAVAAAIHVVLCVSARTSTQPPLCPPRAHPSSRRTTGSLPRRRNPVTAWHARGSHCRRNGGGACVTQGLCRQLLASRGNCGPWRHSATARTCCPRRPLHAHHLNKHTPTKMLAMVSVRAPTAMPLESRAVRCCGQRIGAKKGALVGRKKDTASCPLSSSPIP
jgi:hypothetical protein